jgi:hypothetical protein
MFRAGRKLATLKQCDPYALHMQGRFVNRPSN